ncbi:uncharacterized protein LOC113365803 [Ctenocephalides felis]|uniref:uncharacterized protein LOC113365803 n=1 Tax=Ctenocephalides felis TaxID=7515 RepID=UPI000E6E268E|nr:uncharacterized protein LOC113365803 [Ctenocephalides felis]
MPEEPPIFESSSSDENWTSTAKNRKPKLDHQDKKSRRSEAKKSHKSKYESDNRSRSSESSVSNKVTSNSTRDRRKNVLHESNVKKFQLKNAEQNIEQVSSTRSWDDITMSEEQRVEISFHPDRTLESESVHNPDFNYSEISKDLFEVPEDYSLCHCVAEDFIMGAGIALQFRFRFGRVADLLLQRPRTGGFAYLKDNQRFIYYLVTKQRSSGKPCIEALESSLENMRKHMLKNNVRKLAMPKIGCGLDRLRWDDVSGLIQRIFRNDRIEILVCFVDGPNDTGYASSRRLANGN